MAVLSLINRKGGVGKTTVTLALADHLAGVYRKKILLVDLDSQANLTLPSVGEERWQELERSKATVAERLPRTGWRPCQGLRIHLPSPESSACTSRSAAGRMPAGEGFGVEAGCHPR